MPLEYAKLWCCLVAAMQRGSATMSTNVWGPVAAASASLVWAIGVVVYAVLAHRYAASTINFWRAFTGFVFFAVALLFTTRQSEVAGLFAMVSPRIVFWIVFSSLTSYALGDFVFMTAARHVGAPSALAIASTYPIWSALVGWLARDEKLAILQIGGLLLAVLGSAVVILSESKSGLNPAPKVPLWAWALAFLTSMMWAGNSVTVSQYSALPILWACTLRMACAAVLCPFVGLLFTRRLSVALSPSDFKASVWVLILEGFGGATLYFYGIAHSSLAVGAVLTSLAPALSVPISVLRGEEKPSPRKITGILMVLAGVWLLAIWK